MPIGPVTRGMGSTAAVLTEERRQGQAWEEPSSGNQRDPVPAEDGHPAAGAADSDIWRCAVLGGWALWWTSSSRTDGFDEVPYLVFRQMPGEVGLADHADQPVIVDDR